MAIRSAFYGAVILSRIAAFLITITSAYPVTLQWNANPEPDIAGYRLFYGEQNSSPTVIDVRNVTSYSVPTNPGLNYYFYVTAYNLNGLESAASATITYQSPPEDPAFAEFVYLDHLTRGDWEGVYGSEGAGAPSSDFVSPVDYQINAYKNYLLTWENPTSDVRALKKRTTAQRFATAWTSTNDMYFFINLPDENPRLVSFYFVDYARQGLRQTIEFFDRTTREFLSGTTISNFQEGIYSTWNLKGNVMIKFSAPNQKVVLSGIFFDPAANLDSEALLVGVDRNRGGTWKGTFGREGHAIAKETYSIPTYAGITLTNAFSWVWQNPATAVSALQQPSTTNRFATTWYTEASPSFSIGLNFKDSNYHRVSMYFVDFDNSGRSEFVEIISATTGEVLDSIELSDFRAGIWLSYEMRGKITIRVTRTGGYNAVMSGIFFDPSGL